MKYQNTGTLVTFVQRPTTQILKYISYCKSHVCFDGAFPALLFCTKSFLSHTQL